MEPRQIVQMPEANKKSGMQLLRLEKLERKRKEKEGYLSACRSKSSFLSSLKY